MTDAKIAIESLSAQIEETLVELTTAIAMDKKAEENLKTFRESKEYKDVLIHQCFIDKMGRIYRISRCVSAGKISVRGIPSFLLLCEEYDKLNKEFNSTTGKVNDLKEMIEESARKLVGILGNME